MKKALYIVEIVCDIISMCETACILDQSTDFPIAYPGEYLKEEVTLSPYYFSMEEQLKLAKEIDDFLSKSPDADKCAADRSVVAVCLYAIHASYKRDTNVWEEVKSLLNRSHYTLRNGVEW